MRQVEYMINEIAEPIIKTLKQMKSLNFNGHEFDLEFYQEDNYNVVRCINCKSAYVVNQYNEVIPVRFNMQASCKEIMEYIIKKTMEE